jgi:photosynthetic reaction center cytochrome c subunit
MTRDLNAQYLDSLAGVFPANRLGPTGDVPKLNCATCHQGAYKPLYGAPMLKTHPELSGPQGPAAPAAGAASAPVTTSAAEKAQPIALAQK